MARPRKYSDELRRRAIDEVLERDRKIPEVARELGIGSPDSPHWAWGRSPVSKASSRPEPSLNPGRFTLG